MYISTVASVIGKPHHEGASCAARARTYSRGSVPPASIVVRLGRFHLFPAERLLLKDGAPVSIGGRALDILITLAARAGELVSKAELIAQVWPNTVVEEGSLRFHIAALRKVLTAGCDDGRVICTVPGRGYQLVAETSFSSTVQHLPSASAAAICTLLDGAPDADPGSLFLTIGRASDTRQERLGEEQGPNMVPTAAGSSTLQSTAAQGLDSLENDGNNQVLVGARIAPDMEERNRVLLFGPFELNRKARVLKKQGAPVCLGGRALDLLIALIERPYEVVAKRELMEKVWPDVARGEASLRFQLGELRKALGDGQAGNRYITNVPGRGYCFVARVTPADQGIATDLPHPSTSGRNAQLPVAASIVLRPSLPWPNISLSRLAGVA